MRRVGHLRHLRLEECLERIVDNRGRTPPLSDAGIEMIEVNAIENERKSPNYARVKKFVSENTYSTWFRSGHPKRGDTLISTVGAIGRVAYFHEERGCIAQNVIALRPRRDIIVPEFLYYYLASPNMQRRIASLNIGVAQPSLKVPHLLSVELSIPPISDQQRIVNLLSPIDQLIENYQRRMEILEEMARVLYREWFVDFRFPGYEHSSVIESSIGPIPDGWQVKKLGQVVDLRYGKALRKDDRRNGAIPVFGSSGIVGYHDAMLAEGPGIIVGRKGNVGSVFWSDTAFFVIDTAYYVKSDLPLRYLYQVLPTLNFINGDAAVPGLSREQAYSLEVVVPDTNTMEKFRDIADALGKHAAALKAQTRNLELTRDLLLPRLLSGQIDLDAA